MQSYTDKTIKQYLDDLAARTPAPGGGSSAALSGAMASALMSMAINFTIGNESYKNFEDRAREILKKAEVLKADFLKFFEEDIKSYEEVASAYSLPKDTQENREKRKNIIAAALKKALLVPLDVCRCSVEAIKLCPELAKNANSKLICDVEVPVRLLEAAFYSAKINVVMNQKGITDKGFNKDASRHVKILEKELLRYKKLSEKEIKKITR